MNMGTINPFMAQQAMQRANADEFPVWDNWQQMLNDINTRITPSHWTVEKTDLPTRWEGPISIDSYVDRISGQTEMAARTAVVSEYLAASCKSLIPIYQTCWLLNTRIWDHSYTFFQGMQGKAMIELFKTRGKASGCTPEELATYNRACISYREYLAVYLGDVNAAFATSEEPIQSTIGVNARLLASVKQLLVELIDKREKSLGSVSARTNSGEPKHYSDFKDLITTGVHTGLTPIHARRATGQGLTLDAEGRTVPEIRTTPTDKVGALLLTTALIYHMQKNGLAEPPMPHIPDDTERGYYYLARTELTESRRNPLILGGSSVVSNYRQQLANIDIIFNFFLWVFAVDIKKSQRKLLNIFLYHVGQQFYGKTKINAYLSGVKFPLNLLLNFSNTTGNIHMPPFAFTTSRLYDMVAVFGGIRWDRFAESLESPGVSNRYTTHLKLSNASALSFVISYNYIEKFAVGISSDILNSEHDFHQLLINKLSAYENACQKRGNVFAIQLIGIPDEAPSTSRRGPGGPGGYQSLPTGVHSTRSFEQPLALPPAPSAPGLINTKAAPPTQMQQTAQKFVMSREQHEMYKSMREDGIDAERAENIIRNQQLRLSSFQAGRSTLPSIKNQAPTDGMNEYMAMYSGHHPLVSMGPQVTMESGQKPTKTQLTEKERLAAVIKKKTQVELFSHHNPIHFNSD